MNFGSVLTSSRVGWVGDRGLWAELPPYGILLAHWDGDSGLYQTKFGWFRADPGQVFLTALPVGGRVAPFQGDAGTVPEYGPTGFTPSILRFARLGCWKVTGILGRSRLDLVMSVELMPDMP